ncbi:hypothetical protein CDL15_Pgr016635 [Punica granatum]|uniref:Bromo domain-containing protein n=1 Tax=Punica granatum TaxID=22663 RepID=A0A218XUW9_PUNGR|nr:hypothetical protein CDL15_Pgr016635 [Punica granatum]
MALQKHVPTGDPSPATIKPLRFVTRGHGNTLLVDPQSRNKTKPDVDIDLREVYFLIMHFLSTGPCQRTCGQLWNELLEHQLLPRRYHAWYSRSGGASGDENDDGVSLPLSYNNLLERNPHIEKDHLVKLLKQLMHTSASPSQGVTGGRAPTAADVPTLLGTDEEEKGQNEVRHPPSHMRWPHRQADQVRGLCLREIGGGFARHHRSPSIRAASYAIAKPSTMVQKMQNIKKIRGHRNAVYCASFDRLGRYVITGSDDRLVKIWSMETAYCLASCRGHEGDITDLAVSSNNALVASSSNDCIIRVWRLPDGLPISVLRGHTGAVTAIAFSPRPTAVYQLLSSSDDGTCRIWDARNSQFSPRIYVPRPADSAAGRNGAPPASSAPQNHQIFCCAFNANGTVFVTGSSDTLARVYNAFKPNKDDGDQPNYEIDVLAGHENDVNYVQFSGCAVASRFSQAETLKEDNASKFKNSWFSHDNIVTCSRDGSAIIWIPKSRRSHSRAGRWSRAYHLKVPPPPIPPQPPRGGPRQRIVPTPRGVNMIIWSLDNRFVLAAIMDCRICVWNASDGSLVHSLTGHTDSTYVLDVHPFNPRIAMSAGYDGKTIVWDIWEGKPIRIYEMSRFKLVDGKFSPDGTSIILSDDVGQLYILSTGQGESQMDAKYDQFFLGDYRPLTQDTYGNVLDQETQLAPYRRNLQDLLCDSAMTPYEEPYQSMYQKRRLGALGIEWRPFSLRLTVGPDFSLNQEFQLLPLADLDVLLDPLPEFVDAMDWEPENEVVVVTDDNDSEYNVAEEYSSGGEQGSLGSTSSDEPEFKSEDSEAEDSIDGLRRSKRRKQKAEASVEIMTSSGRRVKRRNLEENEVDIFRSKHGKKHKNGKKKKKSSKSKGVRPRRKAARNALTLFSRIRGASTDGEEEEEEDYTSGSDSSESESRGLDLILQSEESDQSLGNKQIKFSKGKEKVTLDGSEDAAAEQRENSDIPVIPEKRRRLILKLPVRDSNKKIPPELVTNESPLEVGPASRKDSSMEGPSSGANCSLVPMRGKEHEDKVKTENCLDLTEGYTNGKIKWGGVKARSVKRPRIAETAPLIPYAETGLLSDGNDESANTMNGFLKIEGSPKLRDNGKLEVEKKLREEDGVPFEGETPPIASLDEVKDGLKLLSASDNAPVGSADSSQQELRIAVDDCRDGPDNTASCKSPLSASQNRTLEAFDPISNKRITVDDGHEGCQDSENNPCSLATQQNSISHNKTYAVYRRSKLNKAKTNNTNRDGIRIEESTSNTDKNESNASAELESREGSPNGACKTGSPESKFAVRDPSSVNDGLGNEEEAYQSRESRSRRNGLQNEDWGSSPKVTVGLRSTRNRRASCYLRDASSAVEKRKLNHQPSKKGSWLLLTAHEEGSRYIPQQGDAVVYLRQGHEDFLSQSGSRERAPSKLLKSKIRAVEFCSVEGLEYSIMAGSGESCCKMTLRFVDPTSNVFGETFKLTLPEVTGFPDFLVERNRFEAAIQRNWTTRDKCRVWWTNEGEDGGSWWDGRILSMKPKSPEFPDSPWERFMIQYKSDPTETHCHSPWELFDADTQWEQPCIDEESRNKLLLSIMKLEQLGNSVQDRYGVEKLRQVSQKSIFMNRFPVPLSLEVIQSRLENSYYRSLDAVKHDIRVMLSNAESYFGKNQEASAKIKRLSDWFSRLLSSL